MNKNTINPTFQIGDKVIFDESKIAAFVQETTSTDKAIMDYQHLVLRGIGLAGLILEKGEALTTVIYSDGWQIPVPTKYLLIINEE